MIKDWTEFDEDEVLLSTGSATGGSKESWAKESAVQVVVRDSLSVRFRVSGSHPRATFDGGRSPVQRNHPLGKIPFRLG
jgi:hypothetical protein